MTLYRFKLGRLGQPFLGERAGLDRLHVLGVPVAPRVGRVVVVGVGDEPRVLFLAAVHRTLEKGGRSPLQRKVISSTHKSVFWTIDSIHQRFKSKVHVRHGGGGRIGAHGQRRVLIGDRGERQAFAGCHRLRSGASLGRVLAEAVVQASGAGGAALHRVALLGARRFVRAAGHLCIDTGRLTQPDIFWGLEVWRILIEKDRNLGAAHSDLEQSSKVPT